MIQEAAKIRFLKMVIGLQIRCLLFPFFPLELNVHCGGNIKHFRTISKKKIHWLHTLQIGLEMSDHLILTETTLSNSPQISKKSFSDSIKLSSASALRKFSSNSPFRLRSNGLLKKFSFFIYRAQKMERKFDH